MSNRYRGGIISATKPTTDGTPYIGAAGGVWNLVQHARQKQLSLWPKGQGVYAPMDPIVTSIVPGNKNLAINFTAPNDTGGLPITNYTVTVQPGNLVINTPIPNVTVFDLDVNTRYSVTVSASNSYGTSLNNTTFTSDIDQDPYAKNNILYLEFEGANKSTVFSDLSPKNQGISIAGNPYISTANKQFGTSSLYLDGVNSYLYLPNPFSELSSTTSQYTIDFWYYPTSLTINGGTHVLGINSIASGANVLLLGSQFLVDNVAIVSTVPFTLNTWTHVALVSTGSTLTLFLNGTAYIGTTPPTTALSACVLGIGAEFDAASGGLPGNYSIGYVDRFRITAGVARYTSSFNPLTMVIGTNTNYLTAPTSPTISTADPYLANNVLLLNFEESQGGQSFVDSSTSNQVATIIGNPYVTNTVKKLGIGSLYLDGVSSYLYYANAFSAINSTSMAFTIDFWYYPTSLTVNSGVCVLGINSKSSGSNVLLVGRDYWVSNTTVASYIGISLNTWNHIAIASNGTTMVLYINGVSNYSTAPPTTALSNCVLGIGAEFDAANGGSPGNWSPGYVDRFRVTASICRYTSNFDPVATQGSLAGDVYYSNLSLYLTGDTTTSAGLDDASINLRTMTVVGSGVVQSNAVVKVGTYSVYYPGTGNLTHSATATTLIGLNNDFTIEFWMYPTVTQSSWTGIMGNYLDSAFGPRSSWAIGYDGSGTLMGMSVAYASGLYNTMQHNVAVSVGAWTHYAFVRSGSTYTMYTNGIAVSSFTQAGSSYDGGSTFEIGSIIGNSYRFKGYIDDVRIYKGIAKYQSNFTPSATASTPYAAVAVSAVPDAPTNVSATFDTGQSVVSFTPPVYAGGSAITQYKIITNPGSAITTTTSTSATVLNLINGVTYTFRVAAVNSAGASEYSAASNLVQPNAPTVPSTPTITNAAFGNTTATITFTAPTNLGGSAITGYTVSSSPGNFTKTGTSSPLTVSGLSNGVEYTFTVVATNATGDSLPSTTSDVVIPATVPGTPTIGTATYGNAQSTVSFTAPVDNGGSAITSYTVTSSPGGVTATGTSSPITITGLTNGLFYSFNVYASNKAGKGSSSFLSNSVQPNPATVPGAPTITNAVFGNTTATITFTEPSNYGGSALTGYIVTSSPDNLTATGTTSPLTVTGLTNGTSYTFTASAINSTGTGTSSTPSSVVIPATIPAAPSNIVATPYVASASVAFTNPVDMGGDTASSYTVVSSPGNLTGTGSSSPIMVYGLNVDLNYSFAVYATNKAGSGPSSELSNSVRPAFAPDAPTGVYGAYGFSNSTKVYFSAPASNGGYPVTLYTVTCSNGTTATGTSAPITIDGLTNGTAYTFTVKATNILGDSPQSAVSSSVVIGLPGAPSLTSVTYSGGVTATVAFTAPTNVGGSPITSYTLKRNDGVTVSGTSSPLSMSSFTPGVNYYFTVIANNSYGASPDSNQSSSGNPMKTVSKTYTSAASNVNITYSSINTLAVAAGWNGVDPIYIKITNYSNLYATNNTTAAVTINYDLANFPSGTTIDFFNRGNIGGYKGIRNAIDGGTGMDIQASMYLYNYGKIAGGGGAGGCGWPGSASITTLPAGAYLSSSGWVAAGNGKRNSSGGPLVGLKYIYKSDPGTDDYTSNLKGSSSNYTGTCGLTEYCSSGGGGGLGSAGGWPGYGSVNADGSTLDFSGEAPGSGGSAITGYSNAWIQEWGTIYGWVGG